ncbi:RNA polymerase II transcription mediator complex subunit 9-domain-containing protein [Leptodontidium sp. 2 PMI_412]|nr:RNA polymerase II transcription mediator complex subunit 9-domain-containing protein [Leptodontidium sp. MPI-SDFR-AT-0119]KAH9210116.1 RNA polymerase II transcription mediator complex subunit 9-domain-containing protein [Leptodontidium sp. 2 PMI_412]
MSSTPQTTSQPTSLMNLPDGLSPDSIDTLPVLSQILARLQTPSNTSTASTAGSPPAASPSQLTSGTGPLTIKDIPAATDGIKHKLQKARVLVKELPDMERSIAQQDEEMAELEERIRKQRDILGQLRDVGLSIKREREQRERNGGADAMET